MSNNERIRTEAEGAVERAARITVERWDELGVAYEDELGNLLPTTLRTRGRKGEVVEQPVMLALLAPRQRVKARLVARAWAKRLHLDDHREEHAGKLDDGRFAGEDRDLVQELERYCELAFIVRHPTPPYSQLYENGEALYAAFRHAGPLADLNGVYSEWEAVNDPRYGDLDEGEMWRVVEEIVRTRTCLPLVRLGSLSQASCVLFMASRSLESRMPPSSPSSQPSPSSAIESEQPGSSPDSASSPSG